MTASICCIYPCAKNQHHNSILPWYNIHSIGRRITFDMSMCAHGHAHLTALIWKYWIKQMNLFMSNKSTTCKKSTSCPFFRYSLIIILNHFRHHPVDMPQNMNILHTYKNGSTRNWNIFCAFFCVKLGHSVKK